MNPDTTAESVDPNYKGLYKLGGVAALAVALLTVIEVIFFTFYPQPNTVIRWFELFQDSPIIGLLDFWGLEVPMYVMFAMVFLSLYIILRKSNTTGMAIALIFALLGIAIFFATNNPFSMLSLASKYEAATTDVQRASLLAAGEAICAALQTSRERLRAHAKHEGE